MLTIIALSKIQAAGGLSATPTVVDTSGVEFCDSREIGAARVNIEGDLPSETGSTASCRDA